MKPAIKINQASSGQWLEFWEVQSDSRPGVAYVVAKNRKGTWGCSCPAWIFQRGQRGDCKHIHHVEQQLKNPVPFFSTANSVLTPEKIKKALSRFALVEV